MRATITSCLYMHEPASTSSATYHPDASVLNLVTRTGMA
jgi:hypothetical protein